MIEEGDKDSVASLQRVVNLLKSSIVKARDNRLRVTSVEKAAKTIRVVINDVSIGSRLPKSHCLLLTYLAMIVSL